MVSFGLLLTATGIIGYSGLRIAVTLSNQIDSLYKGDVTGLLAVKDIEVDKALVARCSRNAILSIGKTKAIEAQQKDFSKLLAKLQSDLTIAEMTGSSAEERAQLQLIRNLLPAYENAAQQIFQFSLIGASDQAKNALERAGAGPTKLLNEAVRQAAAIKLHNAKDRHRLAAEQFVATRTSMIFMLACAIILGLGLSFWLARMFSTPITQIVLLLQHVAEGDLSRKLTIDTRDELGSMAQALNQAIDRIARTISVVSEASKTLSGTSKQLAASAEQLANGTREQSVNLEETSASLEQITATVRNNSETASEASKLATCSCSAADAGGRVVDDAVMAMANIKAASSKIVEIINAVEEIAFKTNMLAVNAAIEAARAGEQGKGFAVVATEVRTLAQQSSKASTQIRGLIADSVDKVNNGSKLVNQSGQTLSEIVSSVARVTGMVEEIASASQEQALGIQHVSAAMSQMDAIMQRNSLQTEELSATAAVVAGNAIQLEELVSQFRVSRSTGK